MGSQDYTTRRRKSQSHHQRISLVEDVARERYQGVIGGTALTVDTAAAWYEASDNRMAIQAVLQNDSDDSSVTLWTGGSVNGFTFQPGKYEIEYNITVENTHATLGMDYNYGLIDDGDNQVDINVTTVSLDTGTEHVPITFSRKFWYEFTAETNVYFVACLDTVSQTADHKRVNSSLINITKVG